MHAYERTEASGVQHWAVDVMAIRIGSVKHYKGDAPLGACLHHIVQRGKVSIEPTAHILQVEQHHIHILHLLGGRLLVLAVERDDGQPRLRVGAVVDMRTCRCRPAEAMLRAEYLGDVHPRT